MNNSILIPIHIHATKPSRTRRDEDEAIAARAAHERGYADYDPSINPFPAENAIRHERVKRFYDRLVRQYHEYEPIFRDLCEVYGYDPYSHSNKPNKTNQ
jgi:hypothetical protein